MIECDFKEYCTDDCESCNYAKTLKQQQEFKDAVKVLKDVISEAFKPLLNAMEKVIEKIIRKEES